METDKFEAHIKSKLSEREIKPSANAWTKLSKELAVNKPSKRPNYLWMGIAASMLVLIGTAVFYFNSAPIEIKSDVEVVVDAQSTEKVQEEAAVEQSNTVVSDERTSIVSEDGFQESSDNKKGIAVTAVAIEENKKPVIKDDIVLDTPKKEIRDGAKTITVPEDILNSKIAEVVAKVDALALSNTVTDAEVDSLLLQAQEAIVKENLFNSDNSVNAMALLTEVEDELDQSFRDQIFESLKTGFLKVRTAVADRNN
jgi:hypothetical protein